MLKPSMMVWSTGLASLQEKGPVTKKEIVKQIADKIELTQLKTKEIVQLTFDAIVETLLEEKRIELRNFGVFEVKRRKARKARNPRTGDKVEVPPKNVVTFKPGKEMEERIRELDMADEKSGTPAPDVDTDHDEADEMAGVSETGQTADANNVSVGAAAPQVP